MDFEIVAAMSLAKKNYLIYCPWVSFHTDWGLLKAKVDCLNEFDLGGTVESFIKLNYKLPNSIEHSFHDGCFGGGVIEIGGDLGQWLPSVLIRKEADYRYPPGIGRSADIPVYVAVPKVTPFHKIGQIAMPAAPSPLYSVEIVNETHDEIIVALCGSNDNCDTIIKSLNYFGIETLKLENGEGRFSQHFKEFSFSKPGRVTWLCVPCGGKIFDYIFACIVYSAMPIFTSEEVDIRSVHIFAPSDVGEEWNLSAKRWQKRLAKVRNALDW